MTAKPIVRCPWPMTDDFYLRYHDEEWGVPVHDDRRHFEFLLLEGAQAGLSWRMILLRREGYCRAFVGFDPAKVARFDSRKIESLLKDKDIIRNRLKVASAVTNARAFLKVQKEFGSFDAYIWRFTDGRPLVNRWTTLRQIPPSTTLSDTVSKDLKARGFKFVGTTIVYAHLQATGQVNDHLVSCFRHKELSKLR